MKKVYLSICLTFLCFVSFSQQSISQNIVSKNITKVMSQSEKSGETPLFISSSSSASVAAIWEDDFSDPSNWIMTNASIPPLDWTISTNPAVIGQQTTPAPPDLTPFGSTTASNGFLFISSDNTGGGDNDGTPVEAWATFADYIDLTGYVNVQLTFEHSYRWWMDTRSVQISVDNGSTWIDVDSGQGGFITDVNGYPNDQNSNNPDVSTYNISSIAGDQDSVLLRFYYFDNDYWGWWWSVDDVRIEEIPPHVLSMEDATYGGWFTSNPTSTGDIGWNYTMSPLSQLAVNPYEFGATIKNLGTNDQMTHLSAEVKDYAGMTVFSDVSNDSLIYSFTQKDLVVNSTFNPSSPGVFDVTIEGMSDSASTDVATFEIEVTDTVYARDQDDPDGWWRVGRPCGAQVLGVSYDIYSDVYLSSISVHIAPGSVPGTPVFGQLYEDDIAGTADPIYIMRTDDYYLTASDTNNWINIDFDDEYLVAGVSYIVAVTGYPSPLDTFQVSTSETEAGQDAGSYIQDNGCNLNSANPSGTWYTATGGTPMIRMNISTTPTFVEEKSIKGEFKIYPNPSQGLFMLELNNVISDNYIVSVSNILGQEVYSETKYISGASFYSIDLSGFDKGVYMLEILNSEGRISEKIIVE